MSYTIKETFTLPSKGLVYDKPINPEVTLRSMTAVEEIDRSVQSNSPYKILSDVIQNCIVGENKINVYDLCLGDYQFLLYKLRVISDGSEYRINISCPHCRRVTRARTNIDELDLFEYTEDYEKATMIELPFTKKVIKLKAQTPRVLDSIVADNRKKQKDLKTGKDYSILYTTMSFIAEVDGRILDKFELENFILQLPMGDINYIIAKGDYLNQQIGFGKNTVCTCEECGTEVVTPFLIGPEFFRPTIC